MPARTALIQSGQTQKEPSDLKGKVEKGHETVSSSGLTYSRIAQIAERFGGIEWLRDNLIGSR